MIRVAAFVIGLLLSTPALAYDWSGPYIAALAGWGRGDRDIDVPSKYAVRPTPIATNTLAGLAHGYNFQSGAIVYGVEADAVWSNIEPRMTYPALVGTEAIHLYTTYDWLVTLRGRFGYAAGPWLFYGTGGPALIRSRAKMLMTEGAYPNWGPGVAFDHTTQWQIGLAAGGGAEYGITEGFSLRAEVIHYQFERQDFDFVPSGINTSASGSMTVGRIGLALRF